MLRLKSCVAAVFSAAYLCVSTAPANAAVVFHSSLASFQTAAPTAADVTGMSAVTTQAEADALMTANGEYMVGAGAPPANRTADIDLGPLAFIYGAGDGDQPQRTHGFFNPGSYADVGIQGAAYQVYNPINESHSIEATLGGSALAFSIFDPADRRCFVTCGASVFKIDVFDTTGGILGSMTTASNFGGVTFVGLTTDVAFGLVVISEITNGREPYDNEYFGNYLFAAADNGVLETPVPAAGLLMLSGFAAFAARFRKRI